MEKNEVIVKDINIRFLSMVGLMVKCALASIPALIILVGVGVAFGGFITGMMK